MEIQTIKQWIAEGNTEAAVKQLLVIARGTAVEKEALILAGRFQKIRQEQNLGIADTDEGRKEISRIHLALLQALEELEKPAPASTAVAQPRRLWQVLVLLALAGGAAAWYFLSYRQPAAVYPFQYRQHGIPTDLLARIDSVQQNGQTVKYLAFDPSGDWVMLYGRNRYEHNGALPAYLLRQLDTLQRYDAELKGLALGADSDVLLWFDKNDFWHSDPPRHLPPDLLDSLYLYHRQNRDIKDVGIAPGGGWVILWGRSGYTWAGVHDTLRAHLAQATRTNDALLKQIAFSSNGSWLLLTGQNGYRFGYIDTDLLKTLQELARDRREIIRVFMPRPGAWVVFYR